MRLVSAVGCAVFGLVTLSQNAVHPVGFMALAAAVVLFAGWAGEREA